MEKKRNTTEFCFRISFFFLLSICTMIFTSSSASAITCLDSRCPIFAKTNADFQEHKEEIVQNMMSEGKTQISMGGSRRLLLSGPGSSPPRCISKCGKCTPCKPVHITVPPGTPVTTEYYPEAWRCKCGNKLYMP